jgi:ABC-type phosphate transport system substrate-binding protein
VYQQATDATRHLTQRGLFTPGLTYNTHHQVPELRTKSSLVLNFTTLAGIYLGTVDRWDHAAIRELNPTLAHLLSGRNITVIVTDQSPKTVRMLTQALSDASPTFNQQVPCRLSLLLRRFS